jgi:tripeptide aminopeptidase
MTSLEDRLLDLAIQIQQIPAPTFGEHERAQFVRELFVDEQLQDVAIDRLHNVFGRLPGHEPDSEPLILCAHMDTVLPPGVLQPAVRSQGRIHGTGIGDNSLGVAALFGPLWWLRERGIRPAADLWLVGTVCEEGLGNLMGMAAVADRFGGKVRAYLVIEGMALGQLYCRAVGVRRYRVTATTAGGHSWSDYGQPSAIHEIARLITHLTTLPLPERPRTTLNVGVIAGGHGVNVLASQAGFELDVRSETAPGLVKITDEVESVVRSSSAPGVDFQWEVIGERPAGEIAPEHPLVRLATECLMEQGLTPALTSGSTDANIPLNRGFPAIVVGITTGAGAHTLNEYIETSPVRKGLQQLVLLVERLLTARGG